MYGGYIYIMIQEKLDTLLASHTAPTLMGIKPSNLVSLPNFDTFEQMVEHYNTHLNSLDIYFHPVCQCNCKQLLLVYRKTELIKTLCEPQKRIFLLSYGYPFYHKDNIQVHFEVILSHLAQRIQTEKGFPHEIGIFLGYPLDDVVGFIANNGCNYKCSGCWKVYGDKTNSLRLFAEYKNCKRQLSQALKNTNGNLLHCLCTNSIIQNRSV